MESQQNKPVSTLQRKQKEGSFHGSMISQAIHKGLTDLFHTQQCTDFEIIAGGTVFKCHKIVLAAVSDYFKAMFESGMKESVDNQAIFEDLSPKVFRTIFEIIYPRDEEADILEQATEEEMSELLRVADMLQMKILIEKCCTYFKKSMSPTNCIERWKMAKSIMNEEITNYAWQYLLMHFQDILVEDMHLSLQFEEFKMMIKDENLVIDSEDLIRRALIEWIMFDKDNRKQHVADLLKECCLTELDEDKLIEDLAFDPIIRADDEASKLVLRAIRYIRHPVERNSMEIKLRNNMEKDQMLVFIGRNQENRTDHDRAFLNKLFGPPVETILLSHRHQKIMTVLPLVDVKEPVGFCAVGSCLFVTSGKRLLRYAPIDGQWKDLEPLPFPLQNHTMVANEDSIYVIGGTSGFSENSQVLKYDIGEKSWDIVGQVLVCVSYASSVYIGNKIYIFGGMMEGDEAVNSVQEYDTFNNVSTIVCNLPNPCPYSRAERRGDDVYIVTCDGDVVRFSTKTYQIELVASFPDFKRYYYGVEIRRNILSLYGGRRGCENSVGEEGLSVDEFVETIVSVDVTSGRMFAPKRFQFPIEVFGCSNVVMSTKVSDLKCDK